MMYTGMNFEMVDLLGGVELYGKVTGRLSHYRNDRDRFEMMGTDPGQSKTPESVENQNMSPDNRYPRFPVASIKQEPENRIRQMVKTNVLRSSKKERMEAEKREFFGGPSWLLV